MKKIVMLISLSLLSICEISAGVVPLPNDLPTIEALISLHKKMKKAEDAALEKIGISLAEQGQVTKKTNKFNEARTTLNGKVNNAYSYVVLAGALSSTTRSLYDLIKEYTTFTKAASSTLFKKPMATWYYAEANYALAKEVKATKALLATMTASGMNIMRSSMDEKLNLIFAIKAQIEKMRDIIDRTYWWCSVVVNGGFKHYYIWDILNSEVTDAIARGIINQWIQS